MNGLARWLGRAALLVALSATGCLGSSVRTPDELLAWIDTHREHVGCVAYEPGHEVEAIALNPDEPFALASTHKVLILGAYAEAVAAGSVQSDERVRLSDIERYYWPQTDGGAHLKAVDQWRRRGKLDASATVTLDDVAWAMIRFSDNASTDMLLDRVGGRRAAEAFARKMGMTRQQPIAPILGEYVAWATVLTPEWIVLTPEARAARADELTRKMTGAEAALLGSIGSQLELAATNAAGTPREWAALMARLLSGEGSSAAASEVMRRTLEWPLAEFPENRRRYARFGAKGGSLAGVLTEASYREARDGKTFVSALFFRALPDDVEASLRESFAHQAFVRRLAEDPPFRARVRGQLAVNAPATRP